MKKTEMAAHGCLLLHDLTATEQQLGGLCEALEGEGYPVSLPNLFGFSPRDQYDRTPMWQRWLTQAQEAYVELRRVCARVTVIGAGYGGVIATVIAEQYTLDGLILLGCVAKPVRAGDAVKRFLPFVPLDGADPAKNVRCLDVGRLARLANNNLFSIVNDVLVIQAMADERFDPAGGEALLGAVRSKRRETLELKDARVGDMCRTHALPIREAVLKFLQGVE